MDRLTYEGSSYRTVSRKISLISRSLPSFMFYFHILTIVLKAGILAKKGLYDTSEWCSSSLSVIRALEKVGINIDITGIDNVINLSDACVFISNHMSTLETFVLPAIIGPIKEVTFVVKKDLVEYPVFKHIMRSRDPIIVGRTNPREDLKAVLEGGSERIKNGKSIVVFPQTTRASVFDPEGFNTIGIKLAKKADVPVIPVALKTDAWRNGRYIKDFGRIDPSYRVYFAFGESLRIQGRGAEEHERVVTYIAGKLSEWSI